MYFAVRVSGQESEFWVQIDIKICFKPELFAWQTFELNYASNSRIMGSMVKPLGLTIDPNGLSIRVEEIEGTNFSRSLVQVSNDPKDTLRILGLDRRIINKGFETKEESKLTHLHYRFHMETNKNMNAVYEYLSGSWLFHPAHFNSRLAEDKYSERFEDRAAYWVPFIKEWIPEHYPDYRSESTNPSPKAICGTEQYFQGEELQAWRQRTRVAVRDKVFTLFPHVAAGYYVKRAKYLEEVEEQRLRAIMSEAIPVGTEGWMNGLATPKIIIHHHVPDPPTPPIEPKQVSEYTPPQTPKVKAHNDPMDLSDSVSSLDSFVTSNESNAAWNVPIHLDALPRTPPLACKPHPPPGKMSIEAKLQCIARWTDFDPSNDKLQLRASPQDKDFIMQWTEATYAGALDKALVDWAKEMWWHIWNRQCHVNYVGMWKKRFMKEDMKAEKLRAEENAQAMIKMEEEKISQRLKSLNASLANLF